MDHNLTEYRVVVTGDRCGRTRTYTVRSAWMDVVVAAAIASGLKPTTADTQGATVAVQRRAEAAPAEGEVLQARGMKVGTGTIVDATIIAAPSSTKNADGQRDPEMHQTKKGNQWHFGMKLHIGVDSHWGVAHSAVVTAAHTAMCSSLTQNSRQS